MPKKQFFTALEVARMVKLSPQSVRAACREGRLQAEKVGRDWVIPLNAVRRYLIERGVIKSE